MLNKTFIALIFVLVFAGSTFAAETPAIKGTYTQIPDSRFVFDGKQVDIVEFMSFYCSHCFQFEKSIPVIKSSFPGRLRWKSLPVYWSNGSPKPGEAYLIAEEMGKGEEMKEKIFNSYFIEKMDINSLEVLEDIGEKIGLGFDFSRRLRSGEKEAEIKHAMELMLKYNVRETPTLIIAGSLKTGPGMVNTDFFAFRQNVITILKSILGE